MNATLLNFFWKHWIFTYFCSTCKIQSQKFNCQISPRLTEPVNWAVRNTEALAESFQKIYDGVFRENS